MAELLTPTDCGLYCEAGGFHVDPWRPVDRAVITHAHSDHASPGSKRYLCTPDCSRLARLRLGSDAVIDTLPPREQVDMNGVKLSLHPAGHVLGSAQVRVEHRGETWVFTGDYKRAADPTCRPFELVRCDVFITEATFGLPIYRWPEAEKVFGEINDWWRTNQRDQRTSVLYAYTLGKSQRLLAGVDASIGPIYVHGAMLAYVEAYRATGIRLPEVKHATATEVRALRGQALVIAPPSTTSNTWLRKLGPFSQAQASGWMRVRGRRRWQSLDRGFVLSDHADWDSLHQTISETGAKRVGITHGYTGPMTRFLRERGTEAFEVPTRFKGEAETEQVDAEEQA